MSNKRPRVAVLLAAFNGAKYIEEQICSILSQSSVEIHLYIRVDPSTDSTLKICQRYASEFPKKVLLIEELCHEGLGAAGNFWRLTESIDFSSYNFVSYADQDDIWRPFKTLRAIEQIELNGVKGYSSNLLAFWSDGSAKLIHKNREQTNQDYFFESGSAGCTYVLSVAEAVEFQKFLGCIPEAKESINSFDWLVYAFFRSRKYGWYIDSYWGVLYRQHHDNVVGANSGFRAFLSRLSPDKVSWYLTNLAVIIQIFNGRATILQSMINEPFRLRRSPYYSLASWTAMAVLESKRILARLAK